MADVLSGLGGLLGGGNSLQQMQQQFGMINPGQQADTSLKTPLMLSPENYKKMEDAKNQANQFQTNKAMLAGINNQAQLNLKNAMPMMQMSPMRQPNQIQQVNLMDLLKNIGGGY